MGIIEVLRQFQLRQLRVELEALKEAGARQLLSARQAGEVVGRHEKTMRRWALRREIPCSRIHGRVMFDRDDLMRWLRDRREG